MMAYFKGKVDAARAAGHIEWDPLWSFDNARPHEHWASGKCGRSAPWPGFKRARLPAISPDFHKVIEHMFGRYKQFLRELVYMQLAGLAGAGEAHQLSATQVLDFCAAAVTKAAARGVIARDVQSLRTTLEVVAHDKGHLFMVEKNGVSKCYVGSGGDWPAKSLR